MKFELDLIRSGGQLSDEVPTHVNPFRRAVREVTDTAINDALLMNDLPGLSATLAATVLVIAEGLVQHGKEPVVEDFVDATRAAIEAARTVLDRGLLLGDWPQALRGACMVEIAARGALACIGVPYEEVVREVNRAHNEETEADVRGVLARAGLINMEGAGNDQVQ